MDSEIIGHNPPPLRFFVILSNFFYFLTNCLSCGLERPNSNRKIDTKLVRTCSVPRTNSTKALPDDSGRIVAGTRKNKNISRNFWRFDRNVFRNPVKSTGSFFEKLHSPENQLQCVHMYRSGMNKVGIFIFDRFFKKRTEAWKMGGFVYFGVCFWFLKKPTKIKMVFMEISWFLTFFWVKTAKNRQKTAFFARKTNFFQFS